MQQRTVQSLSFTLFALTIIWGGFTLLAYVGVPIHGVVLLSDSMQKAIDLSCPGGNLLCRGVQGIFPAIIHSLAWASPFLLYGVICLVLYGAFVLWQSFRTGSAQLQLRVRLWYLVGLFLALLWLLFTSLTYGESGGIPVRTIVEPTVQAYGNVGDNVLQSLQQNFQGLQQRGCLTLLGTSDAGLQVYEIKEICMQASFFTRVLPQFFFILLLLAELLVLGKFVLERLRVRPWSSASNVILSLGVGACGWIVLLWLLAILSLFTAPFGWFLIVLVPLVLWRQVLYWVRHIVLSSFDVDWSWRSGFLLLGWLLLSYLALNFLVVVRPFPIGWDDIGSYLNRPHLLVSYGHFIASLSTFQWEYLTSLGFLLFGYDSVFGTTASMMINWSAGVLATLSVYLFARTYLGKGRGVLTALLYYTLPLVGHFSFADMKIDNAVFAAGTLATLCVSLVLFPPDEHAGQQDASHIHAVGWRRFLIPGWRWLLLAGIISGFAFGIKATSIMVLMALAGMLLGAAHWAGFVSIVFFAFAAFAAQNAFDVSALTARVGLSPISQFSFTVAFLSFAAFFASVFLWRLRSRAFLSLLSLAVFALGFSAAIAPWLVYNNIQRGNVIPQLALTANNTLSPVFVFSGTGSVTGQQVKTLPPSLQVNMQDAACKATGRTEELDRYWGAQKGWAHYLTLPWRTVMNVDSVGYYVTTTFALLLFPLLVFLPYFWSKGGRWLRWLLLGTVFIVVEWMFLANGIPWYGMGMFLGLTVGLEVLFARAPDAMNRWVMGLLLTLAILFSCAMRFWQFDQQRSLLEYSFGKISAETLRVRTIPYYDDIRGIVLERHESMPDRPYLYRMGTFIPYFIPKNLEIIGVADNQLDTFHCLNQEKNPELTLQRLKALGFNSIIFDTNTATIEQDVNGSLHKKVQELVDFLNTQSLHFQVIVNDPGQGVVFVLIP